MIGNLFKRKAVQRQTQEILFFITPRIYRPDYSGRPTSGTVSNGTRSITIAQPVPLGNPPTNTPTQQQLQQQQNSVGPQTTVPQPSTLPATPTQTATPARPGAAGGQRP